MELKEFDIMLDIKKSKKIEDIEVVQKDYESNVFNISIVEDLEPYNLYGLNAEIAFAKSDGTTVLQDDIEIQGNKIRCVLKTNTIAAPGKVLAEVRILQDLKLLTTARFDFFVRRAIVDDETIESTNEFPVLNEKIDEVNDLIEYVQGMEAIKGDDGKSAYEVWLEAGNTGTAEDYLASLKGEQGTIGSMGSDGKSIEYKWDGTKLGVRLEGEVEYQYVDLQGPEGKQGIQGLKGDPGTSLKILGNYDTLQELQAIYPDGSNLDGGFMVGINYYYWGLEGWTNAGPLQGPKGEQGVQGERGLPGEDGKSIEFIWNGTELGIRLEGQIEYQYVDLKGPRGEKGEPGADGSDAEVTKENVKTALGYTPADGNDLTNLKYSELSSIATNIDSEGIYQNIEWKRKNNTLYAKSALIGSYPYSQIKIDYYDETGITIIKTITWDLTYDDNDFPYLRTVI